MTPFLRIICENIPLCFRLIRISYSVTQESHRPYSRQYQWYYVLSFTVHVSLFTPILWYPKVSCVNRKSPLRPLQENLSHRNLSLTFTTTFTSIQLSYDLIRFLVSFDGSNRQFIQCLLYNILNTSPHIPLSYSTHVILVEYFLVVTVLCQFDTSSYPPNPSNNISLHIPPDLSIVPRLNTPLSFHPSPVWVGHRLYFVNSPDYRPTPSCTHMAPSSCVTTPRTRDLCLRNTRSGPRRWIWSDVQEPV